ncbi:hypothetical protein [Embleya sp. NBC_00896]|uniref:hypothetical protein n=1 Tax=Embleya sp. NBC_00896 TaxID=2975961 RepID=UPI002F90D621|nr:hypothetical protein OG928_48165 [Embleya sp. NBC_00896]
MTPATTQAPRDMDALVDIAARIAETSVEALGLTWQLVDPCGVESPIVYPTFGAALAATPDWSPDRTAVTLSISRDAFHLEVMDPATDGFVPSGWQVVPSVVSLWGTPPIDEFDPSAVLATPIECLGTDDLRLLAAQSRAQIAAWLQWWKGGAGSGDCTPGCFGVRGIDLCGTCRNFG